MSTLEELEERLKRLKDAKSILEAEHISDEKPLEEQIEKRIRELRQQLAKQKDRLSEQEQSIKPMKQEE